ncbi:hypothetical protein COV93_04495, partial [Candidatus Woesearchaeota archaeon CG11_big_fil_rev_8_21_14_0_20_43_8]
MGRQSKENDILDLFFNQPTKQWHFKALEDNIPIAKSKIAKWLNIFQKQNIIKRIKTDGKMPFYISKHGHSDYRYKKRMFAFEKLYDSGLLSYLGNLKDTESIILFGSFSRSDWTEESDIDIFISGNPSKINIGKFERYLHRDIQIFLVRNNSELGKLGPGLIKNIIKGTLLKGTITDE